jgi:hypothetical protein
MQQGPTSMTLRPVLLAIALCLVSFYPTATFSQGIDRMTAVAKGSFTVEMAPQGEPEAADGVALGRMALNKAFAGDLEAVGVGQMLTALTPTKGSAGYVAIERVSGSLHGRKGSFVFQHSGLMNEGARQLSISVVPGSGTGELTGLAGTFALEIVDGTHLYEFDYSLPE